MGPKLNMAHSFTWSFEKWSGVIKKWTHKKANIHVGLEHINVAKRGSAKYIAFLAQYYSLEYYYVLSFISDSWLSANLKAA